jgi:hypothetical protein
MKLPKIFIRAIDSEPDLICQGPTKSTADDPTRYKKMQIRCAHKERNSFRYLPNPQKQAEPAQ